MQYSANMIQDALAVTGVGLSIVFLVLSILMFVVYLFRFIPDENAMLSTEKSTLTSVLPAAETKLSSLHQAVVIATILEDVNVSSSKNFVKINRIKLLQVDTSEEKQ
ncbi:MAG: OadG family transporter subunit [Brevinema sp.]